MNDHPITPTPELLEQWEAETAHTTKDESWHVAVQAARWGADQELEACCKWLCAVERWKTVADCLRSARRPKPLSLKQRAMALVSDDGLKPGEQLLSVHLELDSIEIIRRALEQLDD